MRKPIGLALTALSLTCHISAWAGQPADLIMTNGHIKTPTGWVEAVAIRDGIITKVGKSKTISALAGADTKIIDLNGDTVLPGLHDSHVHVLFAGMEQFSCGLKPAASPEVIAATVKSCAAKKKTGEWLLGGNWVSAVFEPDQQNKIFLDAITPNNPVILSDESHHSVWVNSMALDLAGITRDTPNPLGGIIERDAAGNATGLLRETATDLVERLVPPATNEAKRAALILSTGQMLAYGITSFTDASLRTPNIGPLSELSKEGLIKQRVRGCIVWTPGTIDGKSNGETLIENRAHYAQPRFATDCVKIFLDGVPTESHTGAMVEPYADSTKGDHNRPEKGILMVPQDLLEKTVTFYDSQGLNIKFHAAGDGAVRAALDAVAVARKANGFGGPSHHVGHSTFVHQDDMSRAADLQMTWEFSPYIWYPTPITKDIRKAVGDERMERWLPVREAIDTNVNVVVGSDWSVVPSVNPWLAMETLVTREKPGGSTETSGKRERISLEEALHIYTENAAKLMGHRDKVGSIEVGMYADIIITATNPFKMPITDLHNMKVKMTFINGEKVYEAP